MDPLLPDSIGEYLEAFHHTQLDDHCNIVPAAGS